MRTTELWRTARLVSNLVDLDDGCTVDLTTQRVYDGNGYALSVDPDCEYVAYINHPVVVLQWLEQHVATLTMPGKYVGAWQHDGKLYLDVVTVVEDLNNTLQLARQHGQLAVYDLTNNMGIGV